MLCPQCKTDNPPGEIHCGSCAADLMPEPAYRRPPSVFFPPNPSALTAYYLGIFAIVPVLGIVLGVAAFFLGLQGLRYGRKHPEVRGMAHAWTGVIMGALFGWGQLVVAAVWLVVFRMR